MNNYENTRLHIIVGTIIILLLIPFIAMQFTDEVNWNLTDFLVAGTLLLGTGLICDLVLRKVSKTRSRITICLVLLILLLLIWAELAVGVFGTRLGGD